MPRTRPFRVLVATDGSKHAARAITMTMHCPWPTGAQVRGVVARRTTTAPSGSPLFATLGDTADLIANKAKRRLLRAWPDADVVVTDATPVEGILREAKRFAADVVVVGWRGHGPVRQLLVGSVSRGIVRSAPCAVLVVRAQVGRLNRERIAAARRDLARDAARLARCGWRVSIKVTAGAPLRDVLATVERTKSHLLVVGARGVTGLRRLFLGSVAAGALNHSQVPVLIAR